MTEFVATQQRRSKATVVGSDLAGDNRHILVIIGPCYLKKTIFNLAQLQDFIRAIELKRAPEVDVEEGVNNIKLLDRIWPRD